MSLQYSTCQRRLSVYFSSLILVARKRPYSTIQCGCASSFWKTGIILTCPIFIFNMSYCYHLPSIVHRPPMHRPSFIVRPCIVRPLTALNFSSETPWPFFSKFHVQPSVNSELKLCSNDHGPLIIAAMPICGRILKNSFLRTKKALGLQFGI